MTSLQPNKFAYARSKYVAGPLLLYFLYGRLVNAAHCLFAHSINGLVIELMYSALLIALLYAIYVAGRMIKIEEGKVYEYHWNKWIIVNLDKLTVIGRLNYNIVVYNGSNAWFSRINLWGVHTFSDYEEIDFIKKQLREIIGSEKVNVGSIFLLIWYKLNQHYDNPR
jgi:hypothetical protein